MLRAAHRRRATLPSLVIFGPYIIFEYLRVSCCFSSHCTRRTDVLRFRSFLRSDALELPLRSLPNKARCCCGKLLRSFLTTFCGVRFGFEPKPIGTTPNERCKCSAICRKGSPSWRSVGTCPFRNWKKYFSLAISGAGIERGNEQGVGRDGYYVIIGKDFDLKESSVVFLTCVIYCCVCLKELRNMF